MRTIGRVLINAVACLLLSKISPLRDLLAYDLLDPAGQQLLRIAPIVGFGCRSIEIVFTLQGLLSLSPQQAIL